MCPCPAPHSRRNSRRIIARFVDLSAVAFGQASDLTERRADELDVGRLTFGFEVAPGVSTVKCRADREPRSIDGRQLLSLARRLPTADPADERGPGIEARQRAHGVDVIAEVR